MCRLVLFAYYDIPASLDIPLKLHSNPVGIRDEARVWNDGSNRRKFICFEPKAPRTDKGAGLAPAPSEDESEALFSVGEGDASEAALSQHAAGTTPPEFAEASHSRSPSTSDRSARKRTSLSSLSGAQRATVPAEEQGSFAGDATAMLPTDTIDEPSTHAPPLVIKPSNRMTPAELKELADPGSFLHIRAVLERSPMHACAAPTPAQAVARALFSTESDSSSVEEVQANRSAVEEVLSQESLPEPARAIVRDALESMDERATSSSSSSSSESNSLEDVASVSACAPTPASTNGTDRSGWGMSGRDANGTGRHQNGAGSASNGNDNGGMRGRGEAAPEGTMRTNGSGMGADVGNVNEDTQRRRDTRAARVESAAAAEQGLSDAEGAPASSDPVSGSAPDMGDMRGRGPASAGLDGAPRSEQSVGTPKVAAARVEPAQNGSGKGAQAADSAEEAASPAVNDDPLTGISQSAHGSKSGSGSGSRSKDKHAESEDRQRRRTPRQNRSVTSVTGDSSNARTLDVEKPYTNRVQRRMHRRRGQSSNGGSGGSQGSGSRQGSRSSTSGSSQNGNGSQRRGRSSSRQGSGSHRNTGATRDSSEGGYDSPNVRFLSSQLNATAAFQLHCVYCGCHRILSSHLLPM